MESQEAQQIRHLIEMEKNMNGLIEGRIVHYVMPDGKHTPAIIVKVWNENGLSNLQVFTDGSNALPYTPEEKTQFSSFGIDLEQVAHGHIWQTSRSYSEEPTPGTWHWVEKNTSSTPVGSVGGKIDQS